MLTLTRYIQVNVESASYVSYLDILLENDFGGNLTTNLYDKRDGLNFSTVNSLDPYQCSNVTFIAYIWSFCLLIDSIHKGNLYEWSISYTSQATDKQAE